MKKSSDILKKNDYKNIDISCLKNAVSLKDGKLFLFKGKKYIIVFPNIECHLCKEAFFDAIMKIKTNKSLYIFFSKRINYDINILKLSVREYQDNIFIYYCADCTKYNNKLFSYGILIGVFYDGKIHSIQKINSKDPDIIYKMIIEYINGN